MPEGHIPVNPSDLPISAPLLDTSMVYQVALKKVTVSPKKSKDGTGLVYASVQVEITDGDDEGASIFLNYLPLPVTEEDGYKAKQAQRINWPFGRFCRAFKIDTAVPRVDLLDPSSVAEFQDWISQSYEARGMCTVIDNEFPKGSGKTTSVINDFLF